MKGTVSFMTAQSMTIDVVILISHRYTAYGHDVHTQSNVKRMKTKHY